MNVHPQSNSDSTGKDCPSALIPIEAEGFHAFADAYALDGQWVIFLSIAGYKDAVKAIRARLLTNHWLNVGIHEICLLPKTKYGTNVKALPSGIVHTAVFMKNDLGQSQDLLCFDSKTGTHGFGSLFHCPRKAQCSSGPFRLEGVAVQTSRPKKGSRSADGPWNPWDQDFTGRYKLGRRYFHGTQKGKAEKSVRQRLTPTVFQTSSRI